MSANSAFFFITCTWSCHKKKCKLFLTGKKSLVVKVQPTCFKSYKKRLLLLGLILSGFFSRNSNSISRYIYFSIFFQPTLFHPSTFTSKAFFGAWRSWFNFCSLSWKKFAILFHLDLRQCKYFQYSPFFYILRLKIFAVLWKFRLYDKFLFQSCFLGGYFQRFLRFSKQII